MADIDRADCQHEDQHNQGNPAVDHFSHVDQNPQQAVIRLFTDCILQAFFRQIGRPAENVGEVAAELGCESEIEERHHGTDRQHDIVQAHFLFRQEMEDERQHHQTGGYLKKSSHIAPEDVFFRYVDFRHAITD